MASPVGHSLIGLAIGKVHESVGRGPTWRWYLYCAVVANVPDLDFLPGLLTGDINRYHQWVSHSVMAAAAFGLLPAVAARSLPRLSLEPARLGVASAALYASHLALDFFSTDVRAPFGQPLLWPFSAGHFISPWTPFGGVTHGVPGEPIEAVLKSLFSWHNVAVISIEMLVIAPLTGLAWYALRSPGPDGSGWYGPPRGPGARGL